MATPVNPAVQAEPAAGASPAPTGSENAAGSNSPSPGAQPGSGEPSPGSSPESPNMRQLREQYESTRNQLSEWSRLGDREEISTAYQSYKAQCDSVLEIGRGLGYADEDILASFREDPLGTIRFLHQKQAESAGSGQGSNPQQNDVGKMLQQELDKRLKPIMDRETKRQADEASHRYDSEFDRLYKQAFPEGLPDDVAAFLYDITTEMVSYDPDALKRIKTEGKVSDVAKYFDQAKERFLKVVTSWGAHEKKRTAGKPGEPKPGEDGKKKKFTLDDIIENPGVIDPKYA